MHINLHRHFMYCGRRVQIAYVTQPDMPINNPLEVD